MERAVINMLFHFELILNELNLVLILIVPNFVLKHVGFEFVMTLCDLVLNDELGYGIVVYRVHMEHLFEMSFIEHY